MVSEPIHIPEDGLRLRPSPRKWLVVFGVSVVLAGLNVALVRDGTPGAWLASGFFGLCAAVALAMLLPGGTHLDIRRDGFEARHLFRCRRFAWSEVGPFSVARIGPRPMVVFDRLAARPSRLGKLNAAIAGANDALPDTYGKDADELAALMNAARERALGARVGA